MESNKYQIEIARLTASLEAISQASAEHAEKSKAAQIPLERAEAAHKEVEAELTGLKRRFHAEDYDRVGDPDRIREQFSAAEKRKVTAERDLAAARAAVDALMTIGGGNALDVKRRIWEQHYYESREIHASTCKDILLDCFALFRLGHGQKSFGEFVRNFFGEEVTETSVAFSKECQVRADELRREAGI